VWVRSYYRSDACEFARGGTQWEVVSEKGLLRLDNEPQLRTERLQWRRAMDGIRLEIDRLLATQKAPGGDVSPYRIPSARYEEVAARDDAIEARIAALGAQERTPDTVTRAVTRSLPYSLLAAAAAVLPAAGLARSMILLRHQRLRRQTSLCASCSYDLRATPGRCPECGTAATTLA
jgi:hypothetical protein